MSGAYRAKLVDLAVHIHHQTARALKLSLDGDEDKSTWLPKSLCEYDFDDDYRGLAAITLHQSVAIDKGLI